MYAVNTIHLLIAIANPLSSPIKQKSIPIHAGVAAFDHFVGYFTIPWRRCNRGFFYFINSCFIVSYRFCYDNDFWIFRQAKAN
jgi:hypothetical protein